MSLWECPADINSINSYTHTHAHNAYNIHMPQAIQGITPKYGINLHEYTVITSALMQCVQTKQPFKCMLYYYINTIHGLLDHGMN